jgi:hypothetical protein
MSIPLDRLYHYIENVAQEIYNDRIIIYRFYPHGSKNINDLNNLYASDTWCDKTIYPSLWCNDQEPLDHKFYSTNIKIWTSEFAKLLKSVNHYVYPKNLNYYTNVFKKGLLLHSEKRSENLEKYRNDNELIPVYYWSHAVIARDWFRYSEHVSQAKQTSKIFLIYNRAWSNTREYRLRFAELLIHLNLQEHCKTSINPIEPKLGIHYDSHQFKNSIWRPVTVLENHFPISQAHSHYSADFDIEDYESTDIEVVLETLFDDGRLHLTEKSLRPIAVGQPFILAGTQGSLEYLRSYGFKTFGAVWDESYDLVEDPAERLIQIAELMKYISTWLPYQRERNMAEARAIAEYNRQHFFSQEFFNQVIGELKENLTLAFAQLELCDNYTAWLERLNKLLTYSKINQFLNTNQDINSPTKSTVDFAIQFAQNKLTHL